MQCVHKSVDTKSRKICSVPHCTSYCTAHISLHSFPSDSNLSKIWKNVLGIRKPVTKNMLVCSQHFMESDFMPATNIRRRLKKRAVPSRKIPQLLPFKKCPSIMAKEDLEMNRDLRTTKGEQSTEIIVLASSALQREDDNLNTPAPLPENVKCTTNSGENMLEILEDHEPKDQGMVETPKQKDEAESRLNDHSTQFSREDKNISSRFSPKDTSDLQPEPIQISDQLCRLCLKEEPSMWSLFSMLTFEDQSTLDVAQAFQRLTQESCEDIEKPGVPKHICQNCVNLLINAHDFYEMYEKSNQILKGQEPKSNDTQETYENIELKIEPLNYSDEDNAQPIARELDDEATSTSNIILEDQINYHEEPVQLHSCPICLKKFSALELKQHCRSHEALKTYLNAAPRFNKKVRFYAQPRTNKVCLFYKENVSHVCPYCAEEFTGEQFKEHVQQHRAEGNFRCNICNRIFMGRNHLKMHQLSHKQETPFKCQECGKGFFQQKNFNFHKLTHTTSNDLPFRCEACPKTFSNPEHLKRHRFGHEKFISYQKYYRTSKSYIDCRRCLQKFKTKQELDGHSCKFCCAKCHKIFDNKKEFTGHVCKHKLKPIQCQPCGKVFQLPSSFQAHKTRCSNQTLCYICGKNVSNITQHLQTHYPQKRNFFTCAQCGKQFRYKLSLNRHVNEVHLNITPFRCQYCSKGFKSKWNLAVHERIHLGLKEHVCNICGKGFLEKSYLKKHLKVHLGKAPEEEIDTYFEEELN